MLSEELYDIFRSDVSDLKKPYLWTDAEVWRYMNSAYVSFVRLTGGVADSSSDITQVDVVVGEGEAEVSPLILKFREAELVSTGRKIDIVNHTDSPLRSESDYGNLSTTFRKTSGPVRYMVIGKQRGRVTWVQIPQENDSVQLTVYRLPLARITGEGQRFDDIGDEHHEHLVVGMKALAYGKQDAETFDKGRRDEYKAEFEAYCAWARSEVERYKTKVRTVAYGGY